MRPGEELKDGPPIHGNTGWRSSGPPSRPSCITGLVIYAYAVLHDIEKAKANTLEVHVTGQQFTWSFQYKAGGKTINSPQLYLPKGRPVKFNDPGQGRDPLLLGPRLPPEEGRGAGHHHRRPLHARASSAPTRSSAPSCAASATRSCARPPTSSSPRPSRPGSGRRRRRRRPRGGGGGGGGGGSAPAGKAVFTANGCSLVPHARRRGRERHGRPRPRQGPQGQGQGVHPDLDRQARTPRSRRGTQRGSCPPTSGRRISKDELNALVDYLAQVTQ